MSEFDRLKAQYDTMRRQEWERNPWSVDLRAELAASRAEVGRLENALNRCRAAVEVEHLAKCMLESERDEDLARVGFAFPKWDGASPLTRRIYLDAARAVRNRLLAFAKVLNGVCELQGAALAAQPAPDAAHPLAQEMLEAAASTGHEGTIRLAAQLAGVPPCPKCGFVKQHCKCQPAPEKPAEPGS